MEIIKTLCLIKSDRYLYYPVRILILDDSHMLLIKDDNHRLQPVKETQSKG